MPWPGLGGCSILAWASRAESYGSSGSSGRDGRAGREGQSGPSLTTTADGSAAYFMLSGEDGESGYRPSCDSQPRDRAHDLQAPHGGDGGNGGRGGNGGPGGNLTIYYTDPTALQRLSVNAAGGRGGRGGRGGAGAPGCRCDRRDWVVQTCTGTPGQPDHSCQTQRYFCRDGEDGSTGAFGPDGSNGLDGQIRLVNQLEPLLPEEPYRWVALGALAKQPALLSRNLWAEQVGGMSLLAPGSQVSDTYTLYTGRVEGSVSLDWQAPRPLAIFATENIAVEIQPDGRLTATFADGLWADYTTASEGTQLVVTVHHAVRASDATRLAWGGVQGSGASLKAAVLDLAGESAYLNTQFRLTLKTTTGDPRDDRRQRYVTVYDDIVPSTLISLSGNRFELALGQLPLDRGALAAGTYAQMEIVAVRSLGANRAQQGISWQGHF